MNTKTGTGNKQSPLFGIEGYRSRITVTVVPTSSDPGLADATAFIVKAENNQDVTTVNIEGPGTNAA